MTSNQQKARVVKLEQRRRPSLPCHAQVVIYSLETGEPLTPIDETAVKYIWLGDDGSGDMLELVDIR
jgi:hypothetical protein